MDGTPRPDRRSLLTAMALAPVGLAMGAWAPAAPRSIALTFDDLPYATHASPGSLSSARRVNAAILRALSLWRAPATGFVDETGLNVPGEAQARTGLLRAWVDEGADLGDATYSHVDFTNAAVLQYETGIDRGARVIRQLMATRGKPLKYVRYPFATLGPTPAAAQSVAAFLAARGYRIAPQTIDGGDAVFNLPYLEALKSGDRGQAQRLGLAYVEYVLQAVRYADAIAPRIVGRAIPQVIRLHANDLNADWLYMLIGRLLGAGYSLISLDDALSDPAYSAPGAILSPFGPSWVWRTRRGGGLGPGFTGEPNPPFEVVQAYQRLGGDRGDARG